MSKGVPLVVVRHGEESTVELSVRPVLDSNGVEIYDRVIITMADGTEVSYGYWKSEPTRDSEVFLRALADAFNKAIAESSK